MVLTIVRTPKTFSMVGLLSGSLLGVNADQKPLKYDGQAFRKSKTSKACATRSLLFGLRPVGGALLSPRRLLQTTSGNPKLPSFRCMVHLLLTKVNSS